MPVECYDEVRDGSRDGKKDLLFAWIQDADVKKALVLDEAADPQLVQKVVYKGYADDLTDDEVEEIGYDPFLISYALSRFQERCVVTTEVSSPKKTRKNRKIPNVCDDLGVTWCNQYELHRALGFKTAWKK